MLEYDLEIKPTKLIKGQGLDKMMTNSNYDSLKINFIFYISSGPSSYLHVVKDLSLSPWYGDIVYVLHNLQAPP